MQQLCQTIQMPDEVTRKLLDIHSRMEDFPCLDLLMEEKTWPQGLAELKEALGEDPGGFKRLCAMLRCALRAKETYDRLGIPEAIYADTMAAFSRFVREHRESFGAYGFNRGVWTPRQVSCRLFRIGQLEYELTTLEGESIVSLHIPTDVDLRPEVLRPSFREGLRELHRLFPETAQQRVYCHSWLLSPMLKEFLPQGSNILRFQELFDIKMDSIPCRDILLWVFKNPKLPVEDYPEDTRLQRRLKQFFLEGGQFLEGRGFLL